MEPPASTCALCGNAAGGAEPARAVHGKLICRACRLLVSASEPQRVLPYAGSGSRRRGWAWPVAAALVVAVLCALLLLSAQRAAAERARAERVRDFLAAQAAATAFQARTAETQPAETQPAE